MDPPPGTILLCLGAGPLAGQTSQPTGTATLPSGPSLLFDADTKQYNASQGEAFAPFVFNLTNVWTNEMIIERVKPSCGCTTASMPPVPWHIPPHAGGEVHALSQSCREKWNVDQDIDVLHFDWRTALPTLMVNIALAPASGGTLSEAERKAAMARAAADARAIFQGDCAKCHVEKGRNAMGEDALRGRLRHLPRIVASRERCAGFARAQTGDGPGLLEDNHYDGQAAHADARIRRRAGRAVDATRKSLRWQRISITQFRTI